MRLDFSLPAKEGRKQCRNDFKIIGKKIFQTHLLSINQLKVKTELITFSDMKGLKELHFVCH